MFDLSYQNFPILVSCFLYEWHPSAITLFQEICCTVCQQTYLFSGWRSGRRDCWSCLFISQRAAWNFENATFVWSTSWNHHRYSLINDLHFCYSSFLLMDLLLFLILRDPKRYFRCEDFSMTILAWLSCFLKALALPCAKEIMFSVVFFSFINKILYCQKVILVGKGTR